MIKRGVPATFVRIVIVLYGGLRCAVLWNGTRGYTFDVTKSCGVRQGGVLSPDLFCIYIDDLIRELRQSGHGTCVCVLVESVGCITYAYDIVLLSARCHDCKRWLIYIINMETDSTYILALPRLKQQLKQLFLVGETNFTLKLNDSAFPLVEK